jgi:NADPH:quinone reductase-like Zn-dependent oxidoreductase
LFFFSFFLFFRLEPSSVGEPGVNQVAVKFEASSIHPADIAVVKGLTASSSSSNVGGSEGAGVVESVGSNVSGIKKGDRVLVSGLGVGTWASQGLFEENHVYKLSKKTAWESAASLSSVCAAYVLLADYAAGLKSGDVLINVGAPGAVTMSLTQLASAQGIKGDN